MSFSLQLSDDQLALQEWVHRFAADVIRPVAAEYDEAEEMPWPVIEEAAKIGLYSYEFFKSGYDDPTGLTLPIVFEELAWGCPAIANAITASGALALDIALLGTPEQAAEWGPRCFGTPGNLHLAAWGQTEPDAGTDAANLRTGAVRDGTDWVINGSKVLVSNGGIADVYVVIATVDASLGFLGQASFLVEADAPGVTQGPKEHKMGFRAHHTGGFHFADVRVPGRNILGGEQAMEERLAAAREGRRIAASDAPKVLEFGKPLCAAQAVGLARAALEYSCDYAKERHTFGRPLIEHEAIAFMLADMATDVHATRLLVHYAAWALHNTPDARAPSAMSKLRAGEMVTSVTSRALQILGGYGYTRAYPVEKWYRDARVYSIFEGSDEVQRILLARSLGARLDFRNRPRGA